MIRLIAHRTALDADSLAAAVANVDLVLDCCDNFTTREAVNAACVAAGKPLVSGAAILLEGQLSVFVPLLNIRFLHISIRLAQAPQRWRFQVCEGSSPKRLR